MSMNMHIELLKLDHLSNYTKVLTKTYRTKTFSKLVETVYFLLSFSEEFIYNKRLFKYADAIVTEWLLKCLY